MPALRSFHVPYGAMRGTFQAHVERFCGLVAVPGGFNIAALCNEEPQRPAALILPQGTPTPPHTADAPTIEFFLTIEGQPIPTDANGRPLGVFLGPVFSSQPGRSVGGMVVFVHARQLD